MPNFVSVEVSIAELAHGEKSRTQSLTHSRSLFDDPGTFSACASEYRQKKMRWDCVLRSKQNATRGARRCVDRRSTVKLPTVHSYR